MYIHVYTIIIYNVYIYVYKYMFVLNFTSSWDFVIFREYWISRSRCNIWCSVPSLGKKDIRLFPTVSPWTPLDLQKKNCVARKCFF